MPGNGFAVSWTASTEGGPIRARVFNGDGTERVAERVVNSTLRSSSSSRIAPVTESGGFVVSWGSASSYLRRIFGPDGTPAGADTLVGTTTSRWDLASAPLSATQKYVQVWQSNSTINAQLFYSDGNAASGPVMANYTSGETRPRVAQWADGRFVVAREDSYGFYTGYPGVVARVFKGDGTPSTNVFSVASGISGGNCSQIDVATVADGNDFVATWIQSEAGRSSVTGVKAARFTAAGAKVGATVDVKPFDFTFVMDQAPVVAVDANANVAVAWQHGHDIYTHGLLDSSSAPPFEPGGDEVKANLFFGWIDEVRSAPAIAKLADGSYVVVWQSCYFQDLDAGTGSGCGVYGRKFDKNGPSLLMLVP